MIEVGEQFMSVGSKRLGQVNEVFEACRQGASDPGTEEFLGSLSIGGSPEPAQVFLQEIRFE